MTRLMFWNVEKFSFNKVANPDFIRQTGAGISRATAAAQRSALIMRLIRRADPEILVVIEVATGGNRALGTLVSNKGLEGVERLLADLQQLHAADWCMVPPLRTSNREGVVVFYRNQGLVFSGPFVWSGGMRGSAAPQGAGRQYSDQVRAQVGQRIVPLNARYNPGKRETICAARTTGWTNVVGAPLAFEPRQPYMTTFVEKPLNAAPVREIAIFAIHSPAFLAAAAPYLEQLAATSQIVNAPAQGALPEARVVAGDFNVNLLNPNGTLANPYRALLTLAPAANRYALRLSPPPEPPAPPNPFLPWRGFYATHMRGRRKAVFWPPEPNYPGYGYIDKTFYAIDNIYTRNAAAGPLTILNPVAGSPYNAHHLPPPPAYRPPLGLRNLVRSGGLPPLPAPPNVPPPVPWVAPAVGIGEKQAFRGWDNFGRIRSTSDHLPIVVDV